MHLYDYTKFKNCFICGNIEDNLGKFIKTVVDSLSDISSYPMNKHPKELERLERLNRRAASLDDIMHNDSAPRRRKKVNKSYACGYCLNDSVLIVNGSNCFGEKELDFYLDKLKPLNEVLSHNNAHILFVRGTDDPRYFNGELISLSNIKTIKDYSVVKFHNFNCLCIGGDLSIDRKWKIEQEKRIGRKLYFEDESFVYKEDELDEILNHYDISCIITTSCPTFVQPSMNNIAKSPWASNDKEVLKKINATRVLMDKIYNKTVETNNKPYLWAYSTFKCANQSVLNDIVFLSQHLLHFSYFNEMVSSAFGINLSSDKAKKESMAKVIDHYVGSRYRVYEDDYDFFDEDSDDINNNDMEMEMPMDVPTETEPITEPINVEMLGLEAPPEFRWNEFVGNYGNVDINLNNANDRIVTLEDLTQSLEATVRGGRNLNNVANE